MPKADFVHFSVAEKCQMFVGHDCNLRLAVCRVESDEFRRGKRVDENRHEAGAYRSEIPRPRIRDNL